MKTFVQGEEAFGENSAEKAENIFLVLSKEGRLGRAKPTSSCFSTRTRKAKTKKTRTKSSVFSPNQPNNLCSELSEIFFGTKPFLEKTIFELKHFFRNPPFFDSGKSRRPPFSSVSWQNHCWWWVRFQTDKFQADLHLTLKGNKVSIRSTSTEIQSKIKIR